jgi:hypothetical protein
MTMRDNEPVASREKQVWDKLKDLQKVLDELEKTANVLGAELARVLKDEETCKQEDGSKIPPLKFCALAEDINTKTQFAWRIQSYLNDLINRLEV